MYYAIKTMSNDNVVEKKTVEKKCERLVELIVQKEASAQRVIELENHIHKLEKSKILRQ